MMLVVRGPTDLERISISQSHSSVSRTCHAVIGPDQRSVSKHRSSGPTGLSMPPPTRSDRLRLLAPGLLAPGPRLLLLAPVLLALVLPGCAARDSDPDLVTCGSLVKLLNTRDNVRLHSHDVKYGSGRSPPSLR